MKKLSPLQIERLKYEPKLPKSLANGINKLEMVEKEKTSCIKDQEEIEKIFPNCYGSPIVEFRCNLIRRSSSWWA